LGRVSLVAAGIDRPYLESTKGRFPAKVMTMTMSLSGSMRVSLPMAVLVVFIALLMAGTLALWSYYGTTVFFEMLRAGWAACF
jgi:hypothetical protein